MKRALLPFMLAGALSIAAAAPVGAQTECDAENVSRGGAAGLVQLVNANIGAAVTACEIDIDVLNNFLNNSLNNNLNNSLNNLLRNADVTVIELRLENVLNNSPILSGNTFDVDVDVVNNEIVIAVLSGVDTGDTVTITGL